MLASRIVRQMASGANKDPSKIKKENQRVVRPKKRSVVVTLTCPVAIGGCWTHWTYGLGLLCRVRC